MIAKIKLITYVEKQRLVKNRPVHCKRVPLPFSSVSDIPSYLYIF